MMMDMDVHDEKLNIQYTCDKIAKIDPGYFISIADELVRFISKLKSDLTNGSEYVNNFKNKDSLESSDTSDEYFNNTTGIVNPADYIGKVTVEKDTDNDGDMDTKITEYK